MSNYSLLLPLLPILGIGGFVAFWCLIVKMLSLAGWQRLAQYQVPRPLEWPHTTLRLAKLGGIRYQNAIKAGAQADGLSLKSMFMFRIGHPPLLIPWSAIGPVLAEKSFWSTFYTTTIRTENGGSVSFMFSNERLADEVTAWQQLLGR
ncbi:MAG: hypothetical protein JWP58_885 [Hymenobacter sp.]|nr:hypothetical protein [Hymenobacter sp.]